VHVLGAATFETAGVEGKTLKAVLQDWQFLKVFFDVQNDSDALYTHYGVALQGVKDVQLIQNATRKDTATRRFLSSLTKCVEQNLGTVMISRGFDLRGWKAVKERGERLFKAEHGGLYQAFNQRPLSRQIITYCVGNVTQLPDLRELFSSKLGSLRDVVVQESMRRVADSQTAGYQPHGRERALAPWSVALNNVWDELSQRKYVDIYDYDPYDVLEYEEVDDPFEQMYENDHYNEGAGYNYEDFTRMEWQGPSS
jgi:exonuclease 3'-5' domain-containing protein 1